MSESEGAETRARQGVKICFGGAVVQNDVDDHRKCSDNPASHGETNQTIEQLLRCARDTDWTI